MGTLRCDQTPVGHYETTRISLQRVISRFYLVCLVKEKAKTGEDHPQSLPAITVLKLPKQITRELVLEDK